MCLSQLEIYFTNCFEIIYICCSSFVQCEIWYIVLCGFFTNMKSYIVLCEINFCENLKKTIELCFLFA